MNDLNEIDICFTALNDNKFIDLTHFWPMFHLRINQLIGFY